MTRIVFSIAFLLGALVVAWMGWVFVGSDILALAVTGVIGCVYLIGLTELLQYRQATSTLSASLSSIPKKITVLGEWLNTLHPSLQNSVRLRIEGERVGLPAPVLTPYLVGLLVMLGLLGTFLGMVDTLKGAVIALEGTTELQAIRAGLAAPIKGLSLAFGTSVAGVAASAMLGLMSTLSRRDRMLSTRRLDTKIGTEFREFSLVHNRQETYNALQIQAQALPDVAEKLHAMAEKLESMGDNLGDRLIASQDMFHASVKSIYSELATSVDKSLRESLADSGRLAGENIKPIVKEVMAGISTEAQNTHQQLAASLQKQFDVLSGNFTHTSEDVANAWKKGLSAHERSNEALIGGMSRSFDAFSGQFEQLAASLLESFGSTASSWHERQVSGDKERLDLWADSFGQAQQQAATYFSDASKMLTGELKQVTDIQQSSFKTVTQNFESMSSELTNQWRQAGELSLSQQKIISNALEETSRDLADNARSTSDNMLSEMSRLMRSSEELVQARIETEATWLNGHGERMDNLTSTLATQLETLREEEELRGQAAIERLSSLESTVATHLSTLGQALEEPMTRLIQTASETPRAAAEVIGHLRHEISNNIERDNGLLEERRRTMEKLNTLSSSLEQSSIGQRDAIEKLVDSSANMLKDIGSQFTCHVDSEASKLSEVAAHFAGSALEMSSLGEAFGLAVHLFNESNEKLVENLNRIEDSLNQSTSRSDEQLGYYVAQAREIIDHSMLSQKDIFDELRQISQKEDCTAAEVS